MKWKRILQWSALAFFVVLFAWFQFAYRTSTNDCDSQNRCADQSYENYSLL